VLHDRYNVGVAVATHAGLIVPVVRDADKKDLAAVARAVARDRRKRKPKATVRSRQASSRANRTVLRCETGMSLECPQRGQTPPFSWAS